jgi:phage-related protein
MSMEEITAKLAETFGGQAAEKADTFAGKMDRLKVAFSEGKETVGSFVLDAVTPLVTNFVNNVIPAVQKLSEELGPKLTPIFQALTAYIRDYVIPTFKDIWSFITEFVIPAISTFLTPVINGLRAAFEKVAVKIQENADKLAPLFTLFKAVAIFVKDFLAPILGKTLGGALQAISVIVGTLIDLFANLVNIISKAVNAIKAVASAGASIGGAIGGALGFGGGRAAGGPVSSGTAYVVGERGPELFVPGRSGSIIPNGGGRGTVINLTVNGAIDTESTARQIISILNDSSARGTLGAAGLYA